MESVLRRKYQSSLAIIFYPASNFFLHINPRSRDKETSCFGKEQWWANESAPKALSIILCEVIAGRRGVNVLGMWNPLLMKANFAATLWSSSRGILGTHSRLAKQTSQFLRQKIVCIIHELREQEDYACSYYPTAITLCKSVNVGNW